MIIPVALAAIIAGSAIGVAASYLTSHGRLGERTPASRPGVSASQAARRSTPSTTAAPTGARTSSSGGGTTAAGGPASSVTTGHVLNDQGYSLIRRGDYSAAIPLLRRAVLDLRGVGPADPYQAYANYNLGYALVATGDCAGARAPLGVANRLEASPLVDRAIRRASACAPPGS